METCGIVEGWRGADRPKLSPDEAFCSPRTQKRVLTGRSRVRVKLGQILPEGARSDFLSQASGEHPGMVIVC